MAYQDVRDKDGRLVARVDLEKREVEVRVKTGGTKHIRRGIWVEDEDEKETSSISRN